MPKNKVFGQAVGGALIYKSGVRLYVYWWLEALAIVAVDIFVLISGYFLCESKFKAKNVFKTAVGGVWIYSILFSLLAMKIAGEGINYGLLIKACVPILTKKYWFVNSYILLYILSPYINKLIHSLTKKQFSLLIGYFILFFSIRPTIFPLTWSQDGTGGMGIIGFIMLYCIGAWIRLYYKDSKKIYHWLMIYLLCSFLLVVSKVGILRINENISTKFYSYASPIVLIEAVALFFVFLSKKPMNKKAGNLINKIAKHSFSVYIIHFSMMSVLFTEVFHVNTYVAHIGSGVAAVFVSVTITYVVCTIIDIIKDYLFEKIGLLLQKSCLNRVYNNICLRWEKQLDKLYED